MSNRAKLIAIVLAAFGLGAVIYGASLKDYAQAVTLQLGSALLLVTPVFLLERALGARVEQARSEAQAIEREVEKIRTEVKHNTMRLENLAASTRTGLEAIGQADQDAYRRFQDDLSAASVRSLLDRAVEVGAVSMAGVRVPVPLMWERLRFAPSSGQDVVDVTIESFGGEVRASITWREDENAADFFARVALELQRLGRFPGNGPFDPEVMLGQLLKTIKVALDAKRRGSVLELAPVIELFDDQWVVTTFGLQCAEVPYHIEAERLDEEGFERHVADKVWVKADALDEAWQSAEALHVTTRPQWLVEAQSEP